jgi:hypothetical protein
MKMERPRRTCSPLLAAVADTGNGAAAGSEGDRAYSDGGPGGGQAGLPLILREVIFPRGRHVGRAATHTVRRSCNGVQAMKGPDRAQSRVKAVELGFERAVAARGKAAK